MHVFRHLWFLFSYIVYLYYKFILLHTYSKRFGNNGMKYEWRKNQGIYDRRISRLLFLLILFIFFNEKILVPKAHIVFILTQVWDARVLYCCDFSSIIMITSIIVSCFRIYFRSIHSLHYIPFGCDVFDLPFFRSFSIFSLMITCISISEKSRIALIGL